MNQKNKIIVAVAAIVIIVGAIVIVKKKNFLKGGNVPQTAEEILKERAKQAALHLKTPMGTTFTEKKWGEFDKMYQPKSQFHELAEIIRATYIDSQFKNFSKEDMDKVLSLTLKTFDELDPKNYALTGLLITQLERLPSPAHDSQNYKTLASWYADSKAAPIKKKMAILKLGVQDANPDAKWLNAIGQGIVGKNNFINTQQWLQMASEIRNTQAKTNMMKLVVKDFKSIEATAKPAALTLVSQNPSIAPKEIKDITLKFLQSQEPKEFEASLKAITTLSREKSFTPAEENIIKEKLTHIPAKLNSPYVDQKSKELLRYIR